MTRIIRWFFFFLSHTFIILQCIQHIYDEWSLMMMSLRIITSPPSAASAPPTSRTIFFFLKKALYIAHSNDLWAWQKQSFFFLDICGPTSYAFLLFWGEEDELLLRGRRIKKKCHQPEESPWITQQANSWGGAMTPFPSQTYMGFTYWLVSLKRYIYLYIYNDELLCEERVG